MKTNVTMLSTDRNLFGTIIRHETKTGFMCLSDLQEAYTQKRVKENWSEKRIDHILNYKYTHERIYYILKEQGLINTPVAGFIEEVESEGIATTLKKYSVYRVSGARHTKTVWCNPYIFVLIGLELSPEFYGKMVVWLTDKLIINRIEAGDLHNDLTKAVSAIPNVDYVKLAMACNLIVFKRHETGIRNTASKDELKELNKLQSRVAILIEEGLLGNFEDTLKYLRLQYNKKYYANKGID